MQFIIQQQPIEVVIRKHPKSRSMVLRYQPIKHSLTLTLPRFVSIKQGLSFLEEKRGWIEQQLGKKPPRITLDEGVRLSVLGRPCVIEYRGGRGTAHITTCPQQDDGRLLVYGDRAFLARRVRDALVKCAREEIVRLAKQHAATLGVAIRRVGLRDTHSHWGSCNQRGHLSFSWRLVLAPYEVLDYVVCHEVAHLVHLNHSPAFWRVVGSLCPDYERWRGWLKHHGNELYRFCA